MEFFWKPVTKVEDEVVGSIAVRLKLGVGLVLEPTEGKYDTKGRKCVDRGVG